MTVDGIYSDAGQGSQENELQTTRRRYKITKQINKGGGEERASAEAAGKLRAGDAGVGAERWNGKALRWLPKR